MCFKNRDEVVIKNNWFMRDYSNPTIGITYCNKDEEDWCKSKSEIDAFLNEHPQYFVHQETHIQSNIWENDKIINQHPYYGDKANYFPTMKT